MRGAAHGAGEAARVDLAGGGQRERELGPLGGLEFLPKGAQGCQMAKCDPFLSLDCARVEGEGAQPQSKERKGSRVRPIVVFYYSADT